MRTPRTITGGAGHRSIARERRPGYATGDAPGNAPDDGVGGDPLADAAVLATVVERITAVDLDTLGEEQIRALQRRVRDASVRLRSVQVRCDGTLEQRALREAPPGREQQALRQVRDRTAGELNRSPAEVKRSGETGRRLEELPEARRAHADGALPFEHARLLTDTLRHLEPDRRDAAEAELLAAARTQHPVEFGRTCRRLLAEVDSAAAQRAEDRRRRRRSGSVTQTPDGMTLLRAAVSGIDAATVQTAINAFRRPDAPGQNRTPEQRTADAIVTMCRVALDAGKAPTNRGVRPHILVTVAEPTVRSGTGVCEVGWVGPLPWTEARQRLTDFSVSRVLTDPKEAPTRAGEAVRTVPGGLWKALQVRHATCVGDGCSVPAAWCQVMHLETPYRLEGRLDVDKSAPGCSFHHRMFDRHGWQVTRRDGIPIVHHPDRPPDLEPPPGPEPPPDGTDPDPGPRSGGSRPTDPPRIRTGCTVRSGNPRSPSCGGGSSAGSGFRRRPGPGCAVRSGSRRWPGPGSASRRRPRPGLRLRSRPRPRRRPASARVTAHAVPSGRRAGG